ncbi:hypothetical protein BG006_001319, partial [Podila minutissima]
NDMLYIDYNKKKEVKETGAITCSEAIRYGMLISVLMRNQKDFDGLMRWFLKFKNKKGLLSWQQAKHHNSYCNNPDGGDDSATDGDIDVATSFFYAAHAIWDHEFNHKTFKPLLSDWSEEDKKFLYVTRPSNFILSAFATFQIKDTERSELWGKVLDATISTLQRQLKKYSTGLISDVMKCSSKEHYEPVRKEVLESDNDKVAVDSLISVDAR